MASWPLLTNRSMAASSGASMCIGISVYAVDGYLQLSLAMTDGAARTLLGSGNKALIDRAVPHLITRDPNQFWTAGQWMTELTGGRTLVSPKASRARINRGSFDLRPQVVHSAISAQMALTLARPEGNPPGGRGLALFYVETRDEQGRPRNIEVNRLKDKLGTRKVPTAELTLTGTPAQLVKGTTDGVRNITPLLNITRLWNGISAVALMRRRRARFRLRAQTRLRCSR